MSTQTPPPTPSTTPSPAPTATIPPYPPGNMTLFTSAGELTFPNASNPDWSSYPQCPNLISFQANGVTYWTTLPFIYSK